MQKTELEVKMREMKAQSTSLEEPQKLATVEAEIEKEIDKAKELISDDDFKKKRAAILKQGKKFA